MNNQSENRASVSEAAKRNYEVIKRRKRINFYKKMIVVIVLIAVVIPLFVSIFFLTTIGGLEHQVSQLEHQQVQAKANQKAKDSTTASTQKVKEEKKKKATTQVQPQKEQQPAAVVRTEASVNKKKVYLTFDDGPSAQTDTILNILKKNQVNATFFVVGKTDEHSLKMYQEIVKQGNSIGIHSYTHNYSQIYKNMKEFKKDVSQMSDLIYKATGVRTKYYRFPGGSSNTVSKTPKKQLIQYLNKEGYTYYDWNALSQDALRQVLSVNQLKKNVLDGIHANDNSMVLMHDLETRPNMVKALPGIIKTLKKEGYTMLPITDETKPVQHYTIN